MYAQHEVQRIQHVLRTDDLRKRAMQEVLLDTELLDLPAGAPDMRTIGNAERRRRLPPRRLREVGCDGRADCTDEAAVLYAAQHPGYGPADRVNPGHNLLAALNDGIAIGRFARGQPEFHRGSDHLRKRLRRLARLLPKRLRRSYALPRHL